MDHSGANGRSSVFFYFAVFDCNDVQWTLSTPLARFHYVWMFANDDMKILSLNDDDDGDDGDEDDDDDGGDDDFVEL